MYRSIGLLMFVCCLPAGFALGQGDTFDDKLRHYADQRITLDLDDGVKVNYGKFGDLLAEVKAVHGKKAEGA